MGVGDTGRDSKLFCFNMNATSAGKSNWREASDEYPIDRYVYHEEYVPSSKVGIAQNDIALIKLSKAVDLGSSINSLIKPCDPGKNNFQGIGSWNGNNNFQSHFSCTQDGM